MKFVDCWSSPEQFDCVSRGRMTRRPCGHSPPPDIWFFQMLNKNCLSVSEAWRRQRTFIKSRILDHVDLPRGGGGMSMLSNPPNSLSFPLLWSPIHTWTLQKSANAIASLLPSWVRTFLCTPSPPSSHDSLFSNFALRREALSRVLTTFRAGPVSFSTEADLIAPGLCVRGTFSVTTEELFFEVHENHPSFDKADPKVGQGWAMDDVFASWFGWVVVGKGGCNRFILVLWRVYDRCDSNSYRF